MSNPLLWELMCPDIKCLIHYCGDLMCPDIKWLAKINLYFEWNLNSILDLEKWLQENKKSLQNHLDFVFRNTEQVVVTLQSNLD